MSDSSKPTTLIKVHDPATGVHTGKQVALIFLGVIFTTIVGWYLTYVWGYRPLNLFLMSPGLVTLIGIWWCVWKVARNEIVLYNAENYLHFKWRKFRKKDRARKYDPNTTEEELDEITRVTHFEKGIGLTTFLNSRFGNKGFTLVAIPKDVEDYLTFNIEFETLLNTIKFGHIVKFILDQNIDMGNLAVKYELMLQNPDLPELEKDNAYQMWEWLSSLKGRVSWLYAVHVGIGYHVEDKTAYDEMMSAMARFVANMEESGIHTTLITSPTAYAVLYKQLYTMTNLGGVTA